MWQTLLTLLSSKRVQGGLVTIVSSVLLVFGVVTGPELAQWVEKAVEVAGLLGAVWAAYGGAVAKGPLVDTQ